ncbi:MAG: MFS transporter [Minisyncoccia bacterium]
MKKNILPVLFFTLLVDMIGFGMIIPIVPILFTEPTSQSFLLTGFTVTQQYMFTGFITALYGIMQFFAAPILGELSDVYGRKPVLLLGVSVLALSQLMFGLGITAGSLIIVVLSRAIAGLAGANFSVAQACIADVTEPKDRAKNFGLIGAAFGAGFILGPLLGGFIADMFPHVGAAPFFFAGILGLCNVVSVMFFLPETHHVRKEKQRISVFKGIRNIQQALKDVDARVVYASNFFYQTGFAFFTSFVGILLVAQYDFSASQIGIFFGIIGVWVMITQLFILRLVTKKYTERQILKVTLPLLACALASYPFMPSSAFLYACIPFIAIPNGLSMANITALISRSVSPERQGAALGVNGSVMALAQSSAPLISGIAGGLLGIYVPFMIGSACVFTGWAILSGTRIRIT